MESSGREAVRRSGAIGTGPYEEIYRRIVEGVYPPGQRLIEQRIAEELDTSRTPVREAIHRLEAAGLVVTERNRGAIVRETSAEELVDLYELRRRLEAFAAERAAERAAPEQLDELDIAAEGFGRALARRSISGIEKVRTMSEWNRRFHNGVVAAANHRRLEEMLRLTVEAPLVFRSFRSYDPRDFERSDLFHRLMVTAIREGDGDRAGRLMAEHIDQGRDVLLRVAGMVNASSATDAPSRSAAR